jgi:hypothetical protein
MPGRLLILIFVALSAVAARPARAQETRDSARTGETLRVYVDCRSRFCDFDHFRREITFVDYVRNRQDAQVHVLITTRRTGGGGQEFTLAYIGQQDFQAVDDSLLYFSRNTDTFDEVRAGLTRTIKLGLVRYAARTPAAERLDVTYEAPDTLLPTPQTVDDPWNFWILRVRVGGRIAGEQRQEFFSGNGSFSANRTTEDWKIRLFVSGFYSEDSFELSDSSTLTSIFRDYGGGAFVAKSKGEHWSLGATMDARTSTFTNHDLRLEIGPLIEYNIFPYAESTRRAFTFVYGVVLQYFDYEQITVFGKTEEIRPQNFLDIEYSVRQPFGTINTSLEAAAFLDDWSQHRIEFSVFLNVRLVRGLEFNINGSVERTKDQIFLSAEGIPDEEILLRRRELGTDYRFRANLSLSYTFGSIFNNVVNPRFD